MLIYWCVCGHEHVLLSCEIQWSVTSLDYDPWYSDYEATGETIMKIDLLQNVEAESKYRVRQAKFLFPSDRSVQKRKLTCLTPH
jgi:hypothetical protein